MAPNMFLIAPLRTTFERERQFAALTIRSASNTRFVMRYVFGNRRNLEPPARLLAQSRLSGPLYVSQPHSCPSCAKCVDTAPFELRRRRKSRAPHNREGIR